MRLLNKRLGAWHGAWPQKRQPQASAAAAPPATVTISVQGIAALPIGPIVCVQDSVDARISDLLARESDAPRFRCQRWVAIWPIAPLRAPDGAHSPRGRCQRRLSRRSGALVVRMF